MSMVALTEQDMIDLGEGATINVMDVDGREHIVGGDDLRRGDLEMLAYGESVYHVDADVVLTYDPAQ